MNETTPLSEVMRAASRAAAESDLDRHRASGARLLETAQARLSRAEHDYAMGRAQILADAAVQLDTLKRRTHDALHVFDREHNLAIAELREHVLVLQDMREAGG